MREPLTGWTLGAPATALVALILIAPVGATIADISGGASPFALYQAFFASGFRRTVLWRTVGIATITSAIALVVGFFTALAVSRAPRRWRSVLIVMAVFALLTGVVVRSFAWLIILGRNGILNGFLQWAGITDAPLAMLYTQGAVIVAMVYLFVPLMILTLVGVLEGIPEDLIRAAASLGPSPAATFRQVIFPLAVPGLIVGRSSCPPDPSPPVPPAAAGGERQMVMGTFLHQQAMVRLDWPAASTTAAIAVAVTIAVVLAMTRLARRLNPAAT